MKALISPQQNNLVVEVTANNKIFEVSLPLHWVDCNNEIKAYQFRYIDEKFVTYTPVAIVPTTVSMRQARLALLQSNLLDAVNTAIAAGGEADKITWEYATEVNRSDALVQNMAIALQLSEAQLDELFTLANSL